MPRRMSKAEQNRFQAEVSAWHAERRRWYAVRADGTEVNEGDEVTNFRGEKALFHSVTAFPTEGKSGRITTTAEGRGEHESYPQVYDLTLKRHDDGAS
jgi:hypothetical protein